MSKVDFTYFKGGKTKAMSKKHGDILKGLKLGTYQTRDMVAQRPVDGEEVAPKRRGRPPGVKPAETVTEPDAPVDTLLPAPEQPAPESTEPKGEE